MRVLKKQLYIVIADGEQQRKLYSHNKIINCCTYNTIFIGVYLRPMHVVAYSAHLRWYLSRWNWCETGRYKMKRNKHGCPFLSTCSGFLMFRFPEQRSVMTMKHTKLLLN